MIEINEDSMATARFHVVYNQTFRSIWLNEHQLKTYKLIMKFGGHIKAAELAIKMNASIQAANNILKLLMRKGYLTRRVTYQESGGIEYIYDAREVSGNLLKTPLDHAMTERDDMQRHLMGIVAMVKELYAMRGEDEYINMMCNKIISKYGDII